MQAIDAFYKSCTGFFLALEAVMYIYIWFESIEIIRLSHYDTIDILKLIINYENETTIISDILHLAYFTIEEAYLVFIFQNHTILLQYSPICNSQDSLRCCQP